MEYLFEPKLIGLMDSYEEKLIVMLRVGKAVLQIDQIGYAQVFVIGKRSVATVIV